MLRPLRGCDTQYYYQHFELTFMVLHLWTIRQFWDEDKNLAIPGRGLRSQGAPGCETGLLNSWQVSCYRHGDSDANLTDFQES
jgi:hypothetical protein